MTLAEAITKIKAMREEEQMTIERYAAEITADYPSVRAEHREECLRDVLKILEAIR